MKGEKQDSSDQGPESASGKCLDDPIYVFVFVGYE